MGIGARLQIAPSYVDDTDSDVEIYQKLLETESDGVRGCKTVVRAASWHSTTIGSSLERRNV